jgi:hypothetical protein
MGFTLQRQLVPSLSYSAAASTNMNAENLYRIALQVLRSIPFNRGAHHSEGMAVLGAALCNDLASLCFETYAYQEGQDLLNGLEYYLQSVQEPNCWLNLNVLLWRDIHCQHAAAA